MMYIAVFLIAISVCASNTYEERALGIWAPDATSLDENDGVSYVTDHMRNQLSFDLWYIFLGTFLVCIAEARRITDLSEPSSGNVGLSLGGPLGNTSMSGHYSVFSKVVICLMMIRGRHRGLPYALDRAITLPTRDDDDTQNEKMTRPFRFDSPPPVRAMVALAKAHTAS
ncbi:low-affinity potassium transport protein [Colletotrichum spaethianum]|uniref:Low-affinity potassium transport protein n=1 Tax=Colletotrichum spaethianum TaxID=700344 RepID=A0AA37US26_9PEZI|nr:low-affinity potassium transport protein [Colletotrichum spaethianum]GKT51842.1 low-affinity potassium transport protein [Colletotrichum spaethianum]